MSTMTSTMIYGFTRPKCGPVIEGGPADFAKLANTLLAERDIAPDAVVFTRKQGRNGGHFFDVWKGGAESLVVNPAFEGTLLENNDHNWVLHCSGSPEAIQELIEILGLDGIYQKRPINEFFPDVLVWTKNSN